MSSIFAQTGQAIANQCSGNLRKQEGFFRFWPDAGAARNRPLAGLL